MPWWIVALIVLPFVFSAGVFWGALMAARPITTPDLHDLDAAYKRGLADGLRARSHEIAELDAMAAVRS